MTDLNDTQPIDPPGSTPAQIEAARLAGALTGIRLIPELIGYIVKHSAQKDALNAAYDDAVAEIGAPLTAEKLTSKGIDAAQAAVLVAEYNARG